MFLIIQVPFTDFRQMGVGESERMPRPDWSSDTPSGFIRDFGQVRRRQQGAKGLPGEGSYATIDAAIRFRHAIHYGQTEWPDHLNVNPWYRRLYFDGVAAGRFEFGFWVDTSRVHNAGYNGDLEVNIKLFMRKVFSTPIDIVHPNGRIDRCKLFSIGKLLSEAYVVATTSSAGLLSTDIHAVLESQFSVGRPIAYLRFSSNKPFKKERSVRELSDKFDTKHYLTDIRLSSIDISCLIVESKDEVFTETEYERASRVIFSHLAALAFTASKVAAAGASKVRQMKLREAVTVMIARLKKFAVGPEGEETPGLAIFSEAYEGRVDQLIEAIEDMAREIDKPSFFDKIKGYGPHVHDLALKAAVEATVKQALKT